MRKLIIASLVVAGACLWSPHLAVAGCTASVNCGNGCFASVQECPPPYLPYSFSCSAPSQSFQCTGNNVCTSTSTYIECDGVRQTCTQQCYSSATTADCGGTHLSCAKCQSHQISCPL
ncbi:MAG: hypothetical protein QOF89_3789 [Acidobacteriota bacterium]|jgi:hypothetical protein|nr:hypothetical protein [Acidobacteriota bacterium]